MKKLVIISASPKSSNDPSVSMYLARMARNRLSSLESEIINVRQALQNSVLAFETMKSADALLIIFPLYFYCLPGMLMRFLEDYAGFIGGNGAPQKVYAIVNCGFPDPEINNEAISVVKSFARHIGAEFGFGISIDSGGILLSAKDTPFVKKAIKTINEALDTIPANKPSGGVFAIHVNFPKRLYFLAGNFGWRQAAKKNGLNKRELYKKPYQSNEWAR